MELKVYRGGRSRSPRIGWMPWLHAFWRKVVVRRFPPVSDLVLIDGGAEPPPRRAA